MGSDGLGGGSGSGDDVLLESPALPALLMLPALFEWPVLPPSLMLYALFESLALPLLLKLLALLASAAFAARCRASAACLMRFDLLRLGFCAKWLPVLVPRSRASAALRMRSDLRGAGGRGCSRESSWFTLTFARLLVLAFLPRAACFRRAILKAD